jgi:hypothetical protein
MLTISSHLISAKKSGSKRVGVMTSVFGNFGFLQKKTLRSKLKTLNA